MEKNLTIELLEELFFIDKTNWRLMRKTKPSNRCSKDGFAGKVGKRGYMVVRINGQQFYEHRLIYAMVSGYKPFQSIDHIDGNKLNNNPSNLRDVNHSVNCQNTIAPRKHCISGVRGASLHKRTGKYVARITVNKVKYYIGIFDTPEAANAAYMKAREELHSHSATSAECSGAEPALAATGPTKSQPDHFHRRAGRRPFTPWGQTHSPLPAEPGAFSIHHRSTQTWQTQSTLTDS